MKTLFIDGNNLVHRVFWISKNQPVFNAYFHVYLFLNSIKTYTEQYAPDEIFCVWDERPEHQINIRKELSEEYKLTRDKDKSAEVHAQNSIIKELLCSLGIKSVFPEKYEADDVIAILHNHFAENDKIIITADKDLCQLIDTKTCVYDPIRKKNYNNNNFETELGVKKQLFTRMKAIQGDKSDNIPGLKGFGAVKTRRVLAGEIVLTAEQEEQVLSNMRLVDLSLTLQVQSECEYVLQQINVPQERNFNNFKDLCAKFKFYQIINNIDYWHEIFFMKNRLQNLFI